MNSVEIWIGIPLATSVIAWFLRKRRSITIPLVTGVCLLMALLALILPIGSVIRTLYLSYEVSPTIMILGRSLTLENSDRTILFLIYTFGALWFFGSYAARPNNYLPPVGMAITTLLVASLAVEPFLYAALIIEMTILISIPLIVPSKERFGRGVLRYIIFQTLALPLILFAGYSATAVTADPTNNRLLLQAVLLLSLGFALWMAAFPFYSWIPLLASEGHPYVVGFLLSMLPMVFTLLGLDFLNEFAWLREFAGIYPAMRMIGTLMVLTGGVWAAFQQDLGRLFGYAIIVENGFSLLSIGLANSTGLEILAVNFMPRLVAAALWSLSLALLWQYGRKNISDLNGSLQRSPVVTIGLLVSMFSIGGAPLLGSYPLRLHLLEMLSTLSLSTSIWIGIGFSGLLIAGLRTLGSASHTIRLPEKEVISWLPKVLIILGILWLFVIGIFPQLTSPFMINLLNSYPRLH